MSDVTETRPHLVERAVAAMRDGAGATAWAGANTGLAARPRAADAVAERAIPAPTVTTAAPAGTVLADLAPAPQRAEAPAAPPPPATISAERLTAAGLVGVPGGSRTRLSEEFSVVQQGVLRTLAAEGEGRPRNQVILVTSARPDEGKTFTALNLAAGLAASGARPVLLVDADVKPRSLSDLLGVGDRPGLRTLAAEPRRAFAAALVPTAIPGLRFLPHGRGTGAAAAGAGVAAAIARLAVLFPDHAIVLDSPPCLSTSDPGTLAPVAGQVLLVVEAERTPRAEVETALDLVEACPIMQLVLNRSRLGGTDSFGAYYGGAYYGG